MFTLVLSRDLLDIMPKYFEKLVRYRRFQDLSIHRVIY